MPDYAELQITSNYSFLRGASHIEELLVTARLFGIEAVGITDHNSLAGIAMAHARAAEIGIRLVVGCRLDLRDGLPLLVYPTDRSSYSRLCRLITLGKGRTGKGGFDIGWQDLAAHAGGLVGTLLPGRPDEALKGELHRHQALFGGRAYLALSYLRRPDDVVRLHRLTDMAAATGVATVATGDVLYHVPERRILQDVVTCIREGCTIEAAGFRRERSVDRSMKRPEEMIRRFKDFPDAIARTLEIADRCRFSLSELRYQYPNEAEIPGETPQQALERIVAESLPLRYAEGIPVDVERQLRHELRLIGELDYAPYFLTVHSIVRFARSKGILCQGRGSAANSAVCYVLGVTSIDPVRSGLLFERFISAERREPPDIDVDFESERREEVIQWVYDRYGRDRAALCATVMRFHSRGAIRDVGKVMGLPEDVTGMLAQQVWGWSSDGVLPEHAEALNLNLQDRRLLLTLQLAKELIGFPRQLGTHPGGFVLTSDRLDDLVPIEPAAMADRQVIQWDKDDIDALRFMKVDVLGLGMLGCMRRAFELLEAHRGERLDLASIPAEDPATYAMIRKADTLGTFQIESRAQMSMLPRMKPTHLLRSGRARSRSSVPGPIQGDMVHPYLRRREGQGATVRVPDAGARGRCSARTLGVPTVSGTGDAGRHRLRQLHAGRSRSTAAKSMATFKFTGGVSHFRDKLITGMTDRGYEQAFAEKTFSQLEGFGSYGFSESHAASFALIAYASSWMKCRHPDVFCAALLNAQPMGFYAPAQLVRDAREHGVEIRPVCVNASRWDCTLEPGQGPYLAVRLGLRMTAGLSNVDAADLVAHRADAPYASVEALWRRADVPVAALERLAEADAFRSLGLDRRQALWQVRGLAERVLPLFAAADGKNRPLPEIVEAPVPLTPDVRRGGGGRGLPLRRAEPARSSRRLPASQSAGTGHDRLCGSPAHPRWSAGGCARHRAGAAKARLGQGRDVHHHRGRDRGGQSGPLAGPLREAATPGAVCWDDRLPRPGAARG